MALFLFILVPIGWALFGKLAGAALTAAYFFSPAGRRRGAAVSRIAVWLLPFVYLVAVATGGHGSAASGFRLFGNEGLLALACGIPLYGVIPLAVFWAAMWVLRDLTFGHAPEFDERAARPVN